MSNTFFTIDIGEKQCCMTDADFNANKIDIKALGKIPTTDHFYEVLNDKSAENMAQIIRKLYQDLKIQKKDVHILIPDALSFSQILEVPRLNEKEMQSAIRYQGDQFIPLPIDETSLDLEVLKEDQKNKRNVIFIVATAKKIVEHVQKTVELAGLNPISLENELSAVRRLISEIIKPNTTTGSLFVNFGYSASSIYMFSANNDFLLSRSLKYGVELFVKDIKVNFNMDDKRALDALKTIGFAVNASLALNNVLMPIIKEVTDEINKFILLAKEQYGFEIKNVYLFNYESSVNLLAETIASMIKVQTASLPIKSYLVDNPVSRTFAREITTYLSAIAGNYR